MRNGYVRLKDDRGAWVLEHRMLMERHLGRRLTATESVHHKDGNRQNNALDNLELWSRPQPQGARARDLVPWAREILRLYGPRRRDPELTGQLTLDGLEGGDLDETRFAP
jgi:hypothetical protein